MMFRKNIRLVSVSVLTIFLLAAGFLLAPFTTSCSALVTRMSEEQAAQILRVLTKDGKLPPENAVLDVENKFADTKTGALAKLLRARIRFETNDFGGAAQILASTTFREKSVLPDYALWLRGKSLQQIGNHTEAMNAFGELVRDFPESLRATDARLLWATSALAAGQAAQVPAFLKDATDGDSLLMIAKSYEQQLNQPQAVIFYRRAYFNGAGTQAGKDAETKLNFLAQPLTAQTAEEIKTRASTLR